MSEPDSQSDDLAARVEVCIAKVDLALGEIKQIRAATDRIANDQFELRTGVPSTWRRRLILVTLAACVGALTGGMVGNAPSRHLGRASIGSNSP